MRFTSAIRGLPISSKRLAIMRYLTLQDIDFISREPRLRDLIIGNPNSETSITFNLNEEFFSGLDNTENLFYSTLYSYDIFTSAESDAEYIEEMDATMLEIIEEINRGTQNPLTSTAHTRLHGTSLIDMIDAYQYVQNYPTFPSQGWQDTLVGIDALSENEGKIEQIVDKAKDNPLAMVEEGVL